MDQKLRLYSLVALIALVAGTAQGAAILTIGAGVGAVRLGVNDFGHLNVTGMGTPQNASAYGLAINLADAPGNPAGYYDSTAPGCLCEGWGVAGTSAAITHAGGADVSVFTGNLTLDSFSTPTADSAVSSVHVTSLPDLKVTQDYHPALGSPLNTFEDVVTITNTGASTITNVRYRRVMDWDVPYTEFSEAVTIQGWPATALLQTTDDGFRDPRPTTTGGGIACPANTNFVDCAPGADHGALFDFGFGDLAPGESKSFKVFYGATLSETTSLAALAAVGAEVYSLGQSDLSGGDPVLGTPATYFFGFAGVGGTPVGEVPEPSAIILFGTVLALVIGPRLRRRLSKA